MLSRFVIINAPGECSFGEEELDLWRLDGQQVVVRTECTLLSIGTELAAYTHGRERSPNAQFKYPFRPGYCAVGTVIAVGDSVRGISVAQRILYFGRHASTQYYDVSGQRPHQTGLLLPSHVSLRAALLGRFGRIAQLVGRAAEGEGCSTAVLGCGLVGILVACHLRRSGHRVMLLGREGKRAEIARRIGFPLVTSDYDGQSDAALALNGGPFDLLIDAAGTWRSLMNASKMTRIGGEVVLIGTPRGVGDRVAGDAWLNCHRKSITVKGLHEWAAPELTAERVREQLAAGVAWIDGEPELENIISHEVTPDALPMLYRTMRSSSSSYLGVVVNW